MHLIDKKIFLYSFLMLVSSILFIVFWFFSAEYIIKTEWFTKSNIVFNELSSGIIVIFCAIFFSLIYIFYEIIILKFLIKKKKEIESKFKLYLNLLIANFIFTALTSFILFIISGKYYLSHLFKESEIINKKIEELKNKKNKDKSKG
ncbi:MAG: hypothetical protein HDR31_01790 [Mycoplasma sp.]|nr:hypothetical protein [Mycoplasma sp.]